jgi:hypothetical protein
VSTNVVGDVLVISSRPAPDGSLGTKVRFARKAAPDAYGPVRAPINSLLYTAEEYLFDYLAAPSVSAASNDTNSTCSSEFVSLRDVGLAWFNYFWSWRSCTYQAELDGSRKRFSLGETLVVFVFVLAVLSLIAASLMQGQLLVNIALSSIMIGPMLAIFFLIAAYDYSYNCVPALPLGLGDDTMYVLLYTIVPKCLAGASVVNEPSYDNTRCFSCERWAAGEWSIPNFAEPGTKFGFIDIRYNIAFLLRALWPSAYDALRPGATLLDTPFLGTVLASAFVQDPLDAYATFSRETVTDREFAQYWHGATWITLPGNFIIVLVAIFIYYKLLWPLTVQTLSFLYGVFVLVFPLVFISLVGLYVLGSFGVAQTVAGAEQQQLKNYKKNKKDKKRTAMNNVDVATDPADQNDGTDTEMKDFYLGRLLVRGRADSGDVLF